MSILLHGDCIELLDTVEDNSVDLIYCDLPYATEKFGKCTNCEWDKPIDLNIWWSKIMKKKKLNTPIFMSCNVKLGYELIRTAPKKCPFRYDLVWVKSSSAGFLNAKKIPLRKHELIYVFYEKLPFYDLSSHKHKFLKENNEEADKYKNKGGLYSEISRNGLLKNEPHYDPPLPNSVIKEDIRKDKHETAYGTNIHYHNNQQKNGESIYDPPLPNSVIKEEKTQISKTKEKDLYGAMTGGTIGAVHGVNYDPPLPNSLLEVKTTRGSHSTEKPVELIKWILKYFSKEEDIVLDCTMGSGSTGVACKEMNRNFIGMELNPEIYEIAVNRIEG